MFARRIMEMVQAKPQPAAPTSTSRELDSLASSSGFATPTPASPSDRESRTSRKAKLSPESAAKAMPPPKARPRELFGAQRPGDAAVLEGVPTPPMVAASRNGGSSGGDNTSMETADGDEPAEASIARAR
eukprot:675975-Prymnesium_polylepis.1